MPSERQKQLRTELNENHEKITALRNRVEKDKRDWNTEEEASLDKLLERNKQLRKDIEREVQLDEEAAYHNAPQYPPTRQDPGVDPEEEARLRAVVGIPANARRRDRYSVRSNRQATAPEIRQAFESYLRRMTPAREARALSAGTDTGGGYIVPPIEFVDGLLKAVDDEVMLRRLGTTFEVERAEGLGVPTLEADPSDADWTTELDIGGEDSSMAFGKREIRPHPLAKYIKLSNKLLRSSMLNVEQLVIDRLAYKHGVAEEKAGMTGDGSQKWLGLFTASNDGIPTSRDVATENDATAMTYNGLVNAKYFLKAQYWRNARWLFHRDGVKQLHKIVDGNDRPLIVPDPSLASGPAEKVLGIPFEVSEFVPNTFTTGLYVGMLADFSYYWIVDALNMTFQRLDELFAATNQTGFVGRIESDAMPVLAEAFVRVKLG